MSSHLKKLDLYVPQKNKTCMCCKKKTYMCCKKNPVCAVKKTCMCCKKNKTCMCRRTCRFLHRQPHCERAPSSWAAEVKRVIFKRHLVSSVQGRPRRKNKAETVNSIWPTKSSYLTKVYLHIVLFYPYLELTCKPVCRYVFSEREVTKKLVAKQVSS